MERTTLNVAEVAKLIGVSKSTLSVELDAHNSVCGIPVIYCGLGGKRRRVLVPVAPLLAMLGIERLPDDFTTKKEYSR